MLYPLQKIIEKPFISFIYTCRDIPGGTSGKETCLSLPVSPANAGDINRCGLNPWVRKIPWRRAEQPIPVFLLENAMDRWAWQAVDHSVTKSWTWPKQLPTAQHIHVQPEWASVNSLASFTQSSPLQVYAVPMSMLKRYASSCRTVLSKLFFSGCFFSNALY